MRRYNEQLEADEVWRNAPSETEFVVYSDSFEPSYYGTDFTGTLLVYSGSWWRKSDHKSMQEMIDKGFRVQPRPEYAKKPHQNAQDELKPQNPYQRTIIGLDGSKCVVDVYRVLDAFKTDSSALDHAVKKILCPGTRHAKTREQDLKEAIKSIESELLLMSQR